MATGLRLEEANSLLMCELPAIDANEGAHLARFDLPPLTAKGDRGAVWIPHRVRRQIDDYVQAERQVVVQRAAARGWPGGRRVPVRGADRRGGQMSRGDGGWAAVRWADLDTGQQAQLLLIDEAERSVGPLVLWVSERARR